MRWISVGIVVAAVAAAKSVTGDRLLVVFDSIDARRDYSLLLTDLSDRGFDITIKDPRSDVNLFELEERVYDHALIAPEKIKGLGPGLTPQKLLSFANAGGNLLIAVTPNVPESIRDLAGQLDIDIAPKETVVVDHFAYDHGLSDEKHGVIVGQSAQGPVLFQGTCHTLRDSPMVEPILHGSSSSYCYDSKEEVKSVEDPWAAGTQTFLTSRFQANNNARISISGSLSMFSNRFFNAKIENASGTKQSSANRLFVEALTEWTFQERDVLKVVQTHHHLPNHDRPDERDPTIYRIKQDVTYTAEVSRYEADHWKPVLLSDLQLEFTMLDPYYRLTLTPLSEGSNSTTYGTTFTLPDQHGVFTFNLDYRRPGLSYLENKHIATVRHFAHDEFPRSFVLPSAWPWIVATGSVSIGWVIFCALWLFDKGQDPARVQKKTQ